MFRPLHLAPFLLSMAAAALPAAAADSLDPTVLAKVKAATVFLKVRGARGESQGSGFFVDPRLIVTNAHVVGIETGQEDRPSRIEAVLHSGEPGKEKTLQVALEAFDAHRDLAFLRAEEGARGPAFLDLAQAAQVKETSPVFIPGFPFGDALAGERGDPAITVAQGTVSSLRLDRNGNLDLIQIDGNLNPGNSGGPIVDRQGRVVAVSVATIEGTQVGFSIPCDSVRRNLEGRVESHSIDPATFKEVGSIETARCPVSIWCDDRRIVAACDESKVVAILDATARKPLRAVPIRDAPGLVPLRVLGRAPDGSFMTTWKAGEAARWDVVLYHLSESGRATRMLKGEVEWGTWLDNGRTFFAQRNFGGSPSGVPELRTAGEGRNVRLPDDLFGPGESFHRNFGHCFLTADRKAVVLPTERPKGGAYEGWTFLATPDFQRVVFNFPGMCLAESPGEGLFISWGLRYEGGQKKVAEGLYVSRSTGRVVRRVTLHRPLRHRSLRERGWDGGPGPFLDDRGCAVTPLHFPPVRTSHFPSGVFWTSVPQPFRTSAAYAEPRRTKVMTRLVLFSQGREIGGYRLKFRVG